MRRRLVLVVVLLVFWLTVSEAVDLEHVTAGLLLAAFTAWFWGDLVERLPRWPSWQETMLMGHLLVALARAVFVANLAVAKTIVLGDPPVEPVFVVMRPPVESAWGRVLLSTCITITPGTITIDIDPETGQYIVHALTAEAAVDLFDWQIVREIGNLESWRRGKA